MAARRIQASDKIHPRPRRAEEKRPVTPWELVEIDGKSVARIAEAKLHDFWASRQRRRVHEKCVLFFQRDRVRLIFWRVPVQKCD